jgi:ABC-2 type transport system permease protein
VGIVFLGVRPAPSTEHLAVLVAAVSFGLASLVAMGIMVAGLCLTVRREAWSYPDAIAGALYLVSGVVFPPDVLPEPLRVIAFGLPTTWWLEGMRRGITGRATGGSLAGTSDVGVILALIGTTCVLTLVAGTAFRWFERRARERGLLDQTTGS